MPFPTFLRRAAGPGRASAVAPAPVLMLVLALAGASGLARAQAPAGSGTLPAPPAPDAERLPLWEAGVVGSTAVLPDYPGSDRTRARVVPLPYGVYRGRTLRADQGGLRGRYRFGPDTEVDLSFGGALPATSLGNEAREGLPDLDLLLEIGPRLTVTLARPRADAALAVALPARAVFSTDFRCFDARGYLFVPEVFYADRRLGDSAWRGRIGVGPVFATERLMDYFYTVDPAFARPGRPAYRARGGYLESRVNLSLARSLSRNTSVFVFGRVATLAGATNAESPLLRRRTNVAGGLGLAYSFARSAETVPVED